MRRFFSQSFFVYLWIRIVCYFSSVSAKRHQVKLSNGYKISFDVINLFLISFFFYFFFIGSYMLLSPDEARYAGISLEMLMRGEWIVPYQNGIVFMDKPILIYWLEIIFMKLFGMNEWAARLVPMCFGILGILVTYIAGIRLFNRRTAIMASFILMTAPLYFMLSHYVSMDLAVAVLIASTLWFALIALHCSGGRKRRFYCYFSYIAAGLAILTKGLIGVFFPAIIVGLWIIIFKQWHQLRKIHLLTGIIIILAINAPWYIAMQNANENFFHYFFIVQHFNRYTAHGFNMANPFYYYGIVLCIGFFPWTIFFPQSIFFIANRLRAYKKATIEWFLILWVIMTFVFFSIPVSKISSYILPIFPAIAMMIARYFDCYWNALVLKKSFQCSLVVLLILIGLLIVAVDVIYMKSFAIPLPSDNILISLSLFLILASIIGYIIKRYTKNIKVFFAVFIAASMFCTVVLYSQIKTIMPQTIKIVAMHMRRVLAPNDIPAISLDAYDQAFSFYVRRPLYIFWKPWHHPEIAMQDDWGGELARGAEFSNNYKYLMNMDQFRRLWMSNVVVILCVTQNDLLRIDSIMQRRPYKVITQIDRFYLLTQQ
jgi:hypothetical protein